MKRLEVRIHWIEDILKSLSNNIHSKADKEELSIIKKVILKNNTKDL